MSLNLKKLAQRRHAKKRAEERYGLDLNRKEYAELVRLIQKGEDGKNVILLQAITARVRKFAVKLDKACLECFGKGWEQEFYDEGERELCPFCQGDGKMQIPILYDKSRGTIITFLPPQALFEETRNLAELLESINKTNPTIDNANGASKTEGVALLLSETIGKFNK